MGDVFVSVVVPCRNEWKFIESAISSILSQETIDGGFEVLVADGMSDDGTRELLEKMTLTDSRLRVINNIGRVVPTGLNAAIKEARGDIIVRMDAHTEYAPDYIKRCVEVLLKTGADNVGGPWNARGRGFVQSAIAAAFRSPFGSGGAGSHRLDFEGEVDSVYLGCWWREYLLKIGCFDDEFVRNQDDELNLRIVRSGGKVWQSPLIRSTYFPRNSIIALFNQYKQYGYWKVRVIQKHKQPASFRHLVPGGFVAILFLLILASIFWDAAKIGLLVVAGMYLFGAVLASVERSVKEGRWSFVLLLPVVFAGYHLGYGFGFLRGVVDFLLRGKGAGESFTKLTRTSK